MSALGIAPHCVIYSTLRLLTLLAPCSTHSICGHWLILIADVSPLKAVSQLTTHYNVLGRHIKDSLELKQCE
jgi:hypothetical protein